MPRRCLSVAAATLILVSCRSRSAGRVGRLPIGSPIVLISIDTLRSDHLPAYGYRRVETPAIDRIARDGILFEDAWSQCPLTLPSHATILTGLLPPAHGVRNNVGYRLDAGTHPTLARLLKKGGYATGASVSAWVLRGATGLSDGFDFYDDAIDRPAPSNAASEIQRPGTETVDRALAWAEHVRGRPFFLFVHLYEPHTPYEPPEPYKSRFPLPYDGEIATADASVGAVLRKLDDWKLYDRALVILLSDHGEGLMDHGEAEHGILLYREALQVPLIVKLPGEARHGERVSRPVALADVVPTVLALAGIGRPPAVSGPSLLDPSVREPAAEYSETFYPRIHLGWSELRSLADERHHYIDGPEPELYDRHRDPTEKSNRFAEEGEIARAEKRELDRIPADFRIPAAADREQVKKLAALGYLSASSPSAGEKRLPSPMSRLPELEEIRAAFLLEASGDRKGAIAAFRLLLEKNPDGFDARLKLAQTLEEDGQLEAAADAYREAIRSSPSMAEDAAILLAKVCLELGDLDQARANARLALAAAPGDAHELLARVALQRGDLATAVTEAAGVSGTPVLEARRAVLLANVALRRNRPAEALAVIDASWGRLPPVARAGIRDAEFLRGDALARMNRYPDAESAFRDEIRVFPKNSDAYARLAVLLAVEHRRVRDVYAVLESMYAADARPATAALAAQTLDSIGDREGAATWRRRERKRS